MSKSDLIASLDFPKYYKGDDIVINFSDGVISTGGYIEIKEKGENGATVEKFEVGSKSMKGEIYSFNGMLFDYPYNNIALFNDDFFPNLAKSNDETSVSGKSNDVWANDLRLLWNLSIDGKLFTLSDNGWDSQVDNDYSYHSTTPEYTPGADNSGLSDFVLSPLGGIKQLTIKPSKSLSSDMTDPSTFYEVDLSNAGLLSAAGDLNTYAEFDAPLTLIGADESSSEDESPGPSDAAQGQKVSVRELSLKQKQSIDISEGTKFDITEIGNGTFAIAKSKKQLKQLSRSNADIVYFKNKGKLYFNDNLISKGWGNKEQGGLLANFENKPDLSKSNFDSLIDYVKDYDKSGTKYDDSNWFLTAYRNTPQKEMFSLFDGMKEIESKYEDSEWSGLAIGVFQDSYVNGNAWKILWTNSPDKGPGYRNGISSDQYDAFKNSFGWRGDAEMLSQGKEQYIFF